MTTRAEARLQAVAARDSGSPGILLDPSFVLEILDEQAAIEADALRSRVHRARRQLDYSRLPTKGTTNHVLRHGVAVCGVVSGPPCDWPPGNVWVAFSDAVGPKIVNCLGCQAWIAKEGR